MGNTTSEASAAAAPSLSESLHDLDNNKSTPKEEENNNKTITNDDDHDNNNDDDDDDEDKSHYPPFTWEKLPLYIHIRKKTPYTPTELRYLSKFPLITLEKTTAMDKYKYTDVGSIETAAQIKKYNSECKVLFYWNSIIHYCPMYSFDCELDSGDGSNDCFLKDKDTHEDVEIFKQKFKLYDLSLPKIQTWWLNKAKGVICNKDKGYNEADDGLDGIFIDANVKVLDPNYLTKVANVTPPKKEGVVQGWKSMMSSMHTQLNQENKLKMANLIRAGLPNSGLDSLHYFDGSYIEHFESAGLWSTEDPVLYVEKSIEAVQQAARRGKIIALTLSFADAFDNEEEYEKIRNGDDAFIRLQPRIEYCIGLYLIVAEEYSYLYIHDGYDVNTCKKDGKCKSIMWLKWLAEYDYPLGKPLGKAEKVGFVYTRKFEHVKVKVDIKARRAHLDWSDDWILVSKEK